MNSGEVSQREPVTSATASARSQRDCVALMGVRFDRVTEAQAIERVMDDLAAGRGGQVVTPNLDILRRATRDAPFAAMVAQADLVVADGMPLVWASRLQGTPLPERVAGSSLVLTLAEALARQGRSLYLLGGAPGAAEGAAATLKQRYPSLRIVGTDCPPMGFEADPGQMARLREAVAAASPDVVYVALGSPKQEWLIRELRGSMPRTWWLGVGISLSFLAGQVRRAPRWVQLIGLEWLHRLLQEPRRLARRYLIEGLPFAVGLLTGAMLRRWRPERR